MNRKQRPHNPILQGTIEVPQISSDSFYPLLAFSSELKIPLWRWQRMMIFLLANMIACIITSVSLNIVDKAQVSVTKAEEHHVAVPDAGAGERVSKKFPQQQKGSV